MLSKARDPVEAFGESGADGIDGRRAVGAVRLDDDERRELPVPLLIGGALTSAAISIAGAAAYVAWRWARPGRGASPMVRAARAVRESRAGGAAST